MAMARNRDRQAADGVTTDGRQRLLSPLLARLRASTAEQEQAIIRVMLGGIAVLYMVTAGSEGLPADIVLMVRWIAGLFLGSALLLLAAAFVGLGPIPLRRGFGILLDIAATSVTMAIAGEAGAPLLGIYLWVIVGNGFRYDARYLALATLLSLAGFTLAALNSPYWHAHPFFALSYLLVLLIIPAYVGALLGKLRRAMRQAELASSAKSRFLAKMSHELRTPLNGVIGLSELLLDADLRGQERDFVRTIHASGRTLLGIIESILDFSKIEAGRINIVSGDFDIERLVMETVAMFGAEAKRKGIALDVQLDPELPQQLCGDTLHIRQVLINLLGNAVKFTETGSVTMRVLRGDDGGASPQRVPVRFEVEDTGIGIAVADQPHIFESFRQANTDTSRLYGGTGLGTAIARELVQLMGGRIDFRSSLGQGSVFWLELPLARSQETRAAGQEEHSQAPTTACTPAAPARTENIVSLADHHRRQLPAGGLRLLVAEDNDTNRQVLRAMLERAGHRLTLVTDGEAALDALESDGDALDLLVLDKSMPGRGGLEVFRAQRFMRPQAPIPTIILSADATEDGFAEAQAAGVDAYLTKPVEGRELLDTIARVARRQRPAPVGGDAPAGAQSLGSRSPAPADAQPVSSSSRAAAVEPLLDADKVAELRRLGKGSNFFEELLSGFQGDAHTAMAGIAESLQIADYPALRRSVHALEGSAGEIGALRLVGAVRRLRSLRPFELDSPRARGLEREVRQALAGTLHELGLHETHPGEATAAAQPPQPRPQTDPTA
ncbi:MAG: response regulator [Gammaproteobacteria bacterium]|jgi:two-component system sensor histidine kinase RpfC|nr:response regulator [Gammaproteobacteria bacterium]